MPQALRVLIVEDSELDARLLLRVLRRADFEVEHVRVENAGDMREALSRQSWDLVISDYSMPVFSAREALSVLHASGDDIPFIILSGTIDEEVAVEALKAGAHDFLVKGRLARLVPAIERELREARERKERRAAQKQAQEALQEKLLAEAASRAKNAFLANVSHELRTPLNAIIGFSELLEAGTAGALTPKQREFVTNVVTSGRHLLALINDVLNLAKIEAGRMEIEREPVSLADLAIGVRDTLAPLASKQDLSVAVAIPEDMSELCADPVRLRQILYNLLSNAIKFTPAGGSIRLEASVTGGDVTIEVHDTGIGIRAEDLPRLFREFERLQPTHRTAVEGTGLGLALTKKLVELHGGTIAVRSQPNVGSTFTVRMPRGTGESAEVPEVPSGPSAGTPRVATILIVDDDPLSLGLLRELLQPYGHEILEATDFDEAKALLRERTPALVVTDMRFPGGGGEQILRAVRRDPATTQTPVLAATAQAMAGERQRILAAGFDGYISKPIDRHELVRIVESVLSGRNHS